MAQTKVLLVEDNQRICAQLRSLLESMNLEVHTATTGIEGLLIYNRELPQLVIMEQFLPFLSGEELVQRLRTQVSLAEVPVIIITSSRFGALTATVRSQVNAICQKPLRAQQFREAVTQTLLQTAGTCRPSPIPGLHEPEQFYLAWGELSQTPFSMLMFQLRQQQLTGVLTLSLPQGDRRFSFRQGELVYAESLIPGEMFTQFLCKRLPNRIEEVTLENTVAGTGGRAVLQREAILRARLLHEDEINPLYQLYLENVVIRSLFLMQGPYQFLDDSAYVFRSSSVPINVLLLLFEGVRRYYMPQKLLQALSPYHLYRCHISPLYEQQISSLIPHFQNISFAPHRLSGRTVQQLLREFTSNTALSAQLLQTLSLARLLVFQGPDGTMGQPMMSATSGPVVFEGALSPLGGLFEPPVDAPRSSMGNADSFSLQGRTPQRVHSPGLPMGSTSSKSAAMRVLDAASMTSPEHVGSRLPSPLRGPSSPQNPASMAFNGPIPGLQKHPTFVESLPVMRAASQPAESSQHSSAIGSNREALLGALAGETPNSSGSPIHPQPAETAPAVKVASVDPNGLLTSVVHPVESQQRGRGSLGQPVGQTVQPVGQTVQLVGQAVQPMAPPSLSFQGEATVRLQTPPTATPFLQANPELDVVVGTPWMKPEPTTPLSPQPNHHSMVQGSALPLITPLASSPASSSIAPVVAPGMVVPSAIPLIPEIPVSDALHSVASEPATPLVPPLSEDTDYHATPLIAASPRPAREEPLISGDASSSMKGEREETPKLSWSAQLDIDFLRVQSDNFFLVLNVSEEATNEDIQMSYRSMSEHYRPERVQRDGNPEQRTKAGEVLRRSSQAYTILTDPHGRQRFETQLTEHKKKIRNRLIYSLEQFRQGEVCLEQERFREAEIFFKFAMEANPKEPVYFLRLGWSIYQQKSLDPLKRLLARSYIERAVKMSPIFEDAYLYLGMIHKEEGAFEEAASLFQRILLLNPGNIEAYELLGEVSR